MGCPRYIFTWNLHGLPQSNIRKVCIYKNPGISEAVPLLGSEFSGVYRTLIYMCHICMESD